MSKNIEKGCNDLYYGWYVQDGCVIGTLNRWGKALTKNDFTDDKLRTIFKDVFKQETETVPNQKYSSTIKKFGWINASVKSYSLGSPICDDVNIQKLLEINGVKNTRLIDILTSGVEQQSLYYGTIDNHIKNPRIIFIHLRIKNDAYEQTCAIKVILGFKVKTDGNSSKILLYLVPSYKLNDGITQVLKHMISKHVDAINDGYGQMRESFNKSNILNDFGKIIIGGIEFYHLHIIKRRNIDEFVLVCHQKLEDTWTNYDDTRTNSKCTKTSSSGIKYKQLNGTNKIWNDGYLNSKFFELLRIIHNSIIIVNKTGYRSFIVVGNPDIGNNQKLYEEMSIGMVDESFGDKIASLNFRDGDAIYLTNEYARCKSKLCGTSKQSN